MSTLQHGVDVAARRADDVDRRAIAAVQMQHASGRVPSVLDIGSGAGGQAVRLAAAGAQVTAVDLLPLQDPIVQYNQSVPTDQQIRYVQTDIQQYLAEHDDIVDVVVMQRVAHYLPYRALTLILQKLATITQHSMYLSVTGVDSAIGELHPKRTAPLDARFVLLPPEAQSTFSITAPLCVYTASEITLLLGETGWNVQACWVSAFGNIKIVATPTLSH